MKFIAYLLPLLLFSELSHADVLNSSVYEVSCLFNGYGQFYMASSKYDVFSISGTTDSRQYPASSKYDHSFWLYGDIFVNSDSDVLPDWWEILFNTNILVNDQFQDNDNDSLSNLQEYFLSTSPINSDTDNDGMSDNWEFFNRTNPILDDALMDPDNDGLNNAGEFTNNSDPLNPDTDGDGVLDGTEISIGTNPLEADTNFDIHRQSSHYSIASENYGTFTERKSISYDLYLFSSNNYLAIPVLSDNYEFMPWFEDRMYINSDDDRMPDWWELLYGTDHSVNDESQDSDNDGLTNLSEYLLNTNPFNTDSDGDYLPDLYEYNNGTNPAKSDSILDYDNDGLSNLGEYLYNTDPLNPDTDGDEISDSDEILNATNPTIPNSTQGLYRESTHYSVSYENFGTSSYFSSVSYDNYQCVSVSNISILGDSLQYSIMLPFSEALYANSDDDRMPDWWEILYGTDHSVNDESQDSDNDGLTNLTEYLLNTNPLNTDSDGDSLLDLYEYNTGTNPAKNDSILDYDNDGVDNIGEYFFNTDPLNPDTDGDGISDSDEILSGSNPTIPESTQDIYRESSHYSMICENGAGSSFGKSLSFDNYVSTSFSILSDSAQADNYELTPWYEQDIHINSDNDRLPDWWEILYNTQIYSHDSLLDYDNDGLINNIEYLINTNPNLADTDLDGLPDFWEFFHGTNPIQADSSSDYDNDGLDNLAEFNNGTLPYNNDTDGDGVSDGDEIAGGTNPNVANNSFERYSSSQKYSISIINFDSQSFAMSPTFDNFSAVSPIHLPQPMETITYDFFPWFGDDANRNTDTDRLPDWWELRFNTNKFQYDQDDDPDNDGLTNSTEYLARSNPHSADTDSDGIPDFWEFSNKTQIFYDDANDDPDNDGLNNLAEYNNQTDPFVADVDGDGILDGDEVSGGTNPLVADITFDNFRLSNHYSVDAEIINSFGSKEAYSYYYRHICSSLTTYLATWAQSAFYHLKTGLLWLLCTDTDADGIPDIWETLTGTNPYLDDAYDDPDQDGLTNKEEYELVTNPLSADTDNDGQNDKFELIAGTNPSDPNSKFCCLVNIDSDSNVTLSWISKAGNYYNLYVKDDINDQFELYEEFIAYDSSGTNTVIDNGLDLNHDGDYLDEGEFSPPDDVNVNHRFYKLVIQ